MFICEKNQFYIDNFEKKYCDYLFEKYSIGPVHI